MYDGYYFILTYDGELRESMWSLML
jgi:hypothetical protein